MSEEKIIERVRKMLRLAENAAASEGERENAMRMAHNLLVKHNLTMANVGETSGVDEPREEQNSQLSVYPWARSISHAIAQLYFCSFYYCRNYRGKLATHSFVGKQSNAITANEMSAYVIASVFKELRARYGSETTPDARSFAVGAADQLRDRVYRMRKEAEAAQAAEVRAQAQAQAAPGATASRAGALVLADYYANEAAANAAWIEANVGKLKHAANRTKGVGSDYHDGRDFGNKINLNKQLGGSRSKTLRIA